MPELPEVEIVRRGLAPVLDGHLILGVDQRRPDLRFPLPERFAARVEGQRVVALRRRGKYLLAALGSGETLVMHLGMSGRFTVAVPKAGGAAERGFLIGEYVHETGQVLAHDHVAFVTSAGVTITFNDPRRFGFMVLVESANLDRHPLFTGMGPEPLGDTFTPEYLARKAAGRRADLKAFLMDQRTVAGLGNIYVSEALHRARLSPRRAAAALATKVGLPTERARRLVPAIRAVLSDAIEAKGSTLRDYRQADGREGGFQSLFKVYGRGNTPCRTPGCPGIVRRLVQGGRSTFHCRTCQR